MTYRRRPLLALAVAVAALPSLAAGPRKPPSDEVVKGRFEGVAEVLRVEVPVTVVDRKGQPVRGLSAADFRLVDEGDEQQILGVSVIDLEAPAPADAADGAPVPSVGRRHFLLLFDFSFSSPSAVLRARDAAREFVLDALHPSDLAAVAMISIETGPQLVVTFTPDRAQLARAIDNLELDRRPAQSRDPLRFILEPVTEALGPTSNSGEAGSESRSELKSQIREMGNESARVVSRQIERGEVAYQRSRVSSWSRSLGLLGQALDAVPGRKQVIYFSEGFDGELLLGRRRDPASREANEDFLDRVQGNLWMVDNDDLTGNAHLQADVGGMLEVFRRSDAVIQAVDIAGLRSSGDGTSRATQDALFFVANETGGELFEDANDLVGQLQRVLSRSAVTYTLAFAPSRRIEPGRYHRLKVQVRSEASVKVSHRPGYFEPRPFGELHPLEKSLLAADAIAAATPRAEIGLQVLAAPFRSGGAVAYVPVIVEIDGRTLLADQKDGPLQVEIYAYATDAQGTMQGFFAQSIDLDPGAARGKLLQSGLKYYGHLELPPGEELIRVLVRNGTTGRTGVATRSVTVPDYDPAATALLPPFFMESPSRWLLVREPQPEGGRAGSVVYPFTVNGEPYVPAARPELQVGENADFCLVAYHLGEGMPSLQAWVVDDSGKPDPGGQLFLVERTVTGISGVDKLLARFRPEELAAGDYTLMIALTDAASGVQSQSSIPISVVR